MDLSGDFAVDFVPFPARSLYLRDWMSAKNSIEPGVVASAVFFFFAQYFFQYAANLRVQGRRLQVLAIGG